MKKDHDVTDRWMPAPSRLYLQKLERPPATILAHLITCFPRVPPYRWRFDAQAVAPTRAIALDGKCLRGKFEADHTLGYELLKRFAPIIGQRVEATRLQLLDLYGTRA